MTLPQRPGEPRTKLGVLQAVVVEETTVGDFADSLNAVFAAASAANRRLAQPIQFYSTGPTFYAALVLFSEG